jgi:hypothetical protein
MFSRKRSHGELSSSSSQPQNVREGRAVEQVKSQCSAAGSWDSGRPLVRAPGKRQRQLVLCARSDTHNSSEYTHLPWSPAALPSSLSVPSRAAPLVRRKRPFLDLAHRTSRITQAPGPAPEKKKVTTRCVRSGGRSLMMRRRPGSCGVGTDLDERVVGHGLGSLAR